MGISADEFLGKTLADLRGLHETLRNRGQLLFLDSVAGIDAFKGRSNVVIFCSYQWLSWTFAGPDVTQHGAMKLALAEIVGRDLTSAHNIWLDILSISQHNNTQKRLAVNSLYTYVRQADVLLIIAPNSQHQDLHQLANAQTYKSRVWTRAEQVSFFCSRGIEQMYIITKETLQNVPDGWMDDVAALFEGDMTCCSRKHIDGGPCDRESLVLPMLGMYFDVCVNIQEVSSRDTDCTRKHQIFALIAKQKDRMFPSTYDYIKPSGAVAKKVLFGDFIARVDQMLASREQLKTLISMHASQGMMESSKSSGNAAHSNTDLVIPNGSARLQGFRDGYQDACRQWQIPVDEAQLRLAVRSAALETVNDIFEV